MNMVIHEGPGIDGTFSFYNILSEAFKKSRSVLVIIEYVRFVDSSHYDMVQGSKYVQSRLAWHEVILLNPVCFVKLTNCLI